MELLSASEELLEAAGFETERVTSANNHSLVFEDATIAGFVLFYDGPASLMTNWERDSKQLIETYQFGLRRAGTKAWNLYTILIASDTGTTAQLAQLNSIEEDLVGTRKIARCSVTSISGLQEVFLPLLKLHAAPQMRAVDIRSEIRLRATELEQRVVDAFLSESDDSSIVQVMEDEP